MSPADGTVQRGEVVWRPPADVLEHTQVGAFLAWVSGHRGRHLTTHEQLWRW